VEISFSDARSKVVSLGKNENEVDPEWEEVEELSMMG
jgi:hypothetical protein